MRTNTLTRRSDRSDFLDLMAPIDLLRSLRQEMIRLEEYTDGDSFVIRAELPDIDPEKDLDVRVVDRTLMIEARREERREMQEDDGFRSEFHYGVHVRSVPLPNAVTSDKIDATYRNGVLEIRMPKIEDGQRTMRIEVKAE
jgi:HSP20 family protein